MARVANKRSYYAGSPQSLTGDLIREGVTGTAGHVAEPFLDGTIRPDILFPAYASGRTLAEAFYLAMRYVSWQTVVIGDPLCAPFSKGLPTLTAPPVDPTTGLPGWMSQSRVRSESAGGVPEAAVRAFIRADTRIVKGDRAGARQDLERATALDEGYAKAQGLLASLYELDGQHDLAHERYRKQLAVDKQNVAALNNLAYGLAVRKNAPIEALAARPEGSGHRAEEPGGRRHPRVGVLPAGRPPAGRALPRAGRAGRPSECRDPAASGRSSAGGRPHRRRAEAVCRGRCRQSRRRRHGIGQGVGQETAAMNPALSSKPSPQIRGRAPMSDQSRLERGLVEVWLSRSNSLSYSVKMS